MFVDWCLIQTFGLETAWKMTGQELRGLGAGCTFSAQYYAKIGRLYTDNPKPGDQIFFSRDNGASMYHTGLVEKVENGYVCTIEGNTSSAYGVVANGGGVSRKRYPLSYGQIGGYGRPDWSLAEGMTEEDENMTLDKFKELM